MSQSVIWQVPNLAQGIVDNTAGTLTVQTYDTSSSSYVTQWTMDLSTGAITLAEGQRLGKSLTVDGTSTLSGDVTASKSLTVDGTSTLGGPVTLSKSLTVDGTSAFGEPVKNNSATKDVTGATAGSFTWVMTEQGSAQKTVLVYFNGYENDTTTAQTITYPTAFTDTPAIDNQAVVAGLSTDTTQLTINPDNTTKYTGWVKVWGF